MTQTNNTILFKTKSKGEYVYDDKTGTVIPVNELLKEAIDLYPGCDIDTVRAKLIQKYPELYVDGALKFIERWNKTYGGFYSTPSEKSAVTQKMKYFKKEDIKLTISNAPNAFRQLILNVTEDCNLRCRYCIYSDNYEYTRNTNKSKMKLETGKKAMDYFFKLNEQHARRNPAKMLAITFYGGEPLLCLSTMDKLINYARKNAPLPFQLLMTTNGLLLNNEVADFIVNNDIAVSISLDGTKENHDRNRITINEKGSFDIVYNNIKRFIDRHPHHLGKLSTICTYDFNTDLEANAQFFEEKNLPRVSFTDAVASGGDNDTYYDRFTVDDEERFSKQFGRLMRRYIRDLLAGKKPSAFEKTLCGSKFTVFRTHRKALDKQSPMIPFGTTCKPGEKISVRTDGTFDICERVNASMPIGNVETGLDWNAIANVIKKWNDAMETKCLSCPCTKLCSRCYGDGISMRNGCFSITGERCEWILQDAVQGLFVYYSILELKSDAFDWVDDFLLQPEKQFSF